MIKIFKHIHIIAILISSIAIAQPTKKRFSVATSINYTKNERDNAFSGYIENTNSQTQAYNLKLRYFITNHLFAGVGYIKSISDYDYKRNRDTYFMNNTTNRQSKGAELSLGYYTMLNTKVAFYVSVNYQKGISSQNAKNQNFDSTAVYYDYRFWENNTISKFYTITITPQIEYFPTKNFGINLSLANQGYQFSNNNTVGNNIDIHTYNGQNTQNINTKANSSSTELNYTGSFSLSNIMLGISWHFGKNQIKETP